MKPAENCSLASDQILRLLAHGTIEIKGRIPRSSNIIFLVTVQGEGSSALAVYKPQRGERPLWDFPVGTLGKREVAAYRLCEALKWRLIPPTVWRHGPYGPGSMQLFVEAQEGVHFFTVKDNPAYLQDLRRLATFDLITNNADRKSGHCLVDRQGCLWAIDNALTFHVEPKLRTVIWSYAGEPLPTDILADLNALVARLNSGSPLSQILERLVSEDEVMALRYRLSWLIELGHFPDPGPYYPVPWPLV